MIEEIKKEVSFEYMMKIYKDSRVEVILRQFHYEHNLLRKYLNAWEELKEFNINSDWYINETQVETMKELIEELEKKHNIGDKQ